MLDCDVMIVGAGPVGLTLALILNKFGIAYKIIDKQSEWSDKSKAMTITSRTLELLNTLNVADEMVKKGVPSDCINYYYGAFRIGKANFNYLDSKYNFILQIPQATTINILNDFLSSSHSAVDREMEFQKFENKDAWIESQVFNKKTGRHEIFRSRYLIACDGGNSAVRKSDGICFQGEMQEETFLMADVAIKGLELNFEERHLFYLKERSFFYIMPIEKKSDDLIYRIITTEKYRDNYADDDVIKMFTDILHKLNFKKAVLYLPRWISTFNPKQYVVDNFYKNRVVYAGDAAHVQSPIGSQGLNTGIQDAFNVGWKLAFVLQNKMPASMIDTYSEERLPVAHQLFNYNNKISKVVFGYRPLKRFFHILPKFALKIKRFNSNEIQTISQHKLSYHVSDKKLLVGTRLPNFTTLDGRSVYDVISPTQFNMILFKNNSDLSLNDHQRALVNIIVVKNADNKQQNKLFSHLLGVLVRPDCYILSELRSEADLSFSFPLRS